MQSAMNPADVSVDEIWKKVLLSLEKETTEITMNTWMRPLKPVRIDDSALILLAPSAFHVNFTENYHSLIQNTLNSVVPIGLNIRIISDMTEIEPTGPQSQPLSVHPNFMTENKGDEAEESNDSIFQHYTFDTFVVGGGNRFAHAACVAVADQQGGSSYNPLFLYGGSGLGKTHLMHAIGNHVRKNFPTKKLIYVQSERFLNEFIDTIGKKNYTEFRNKYRNCDLLLIDDIQFIEGKESTQIEFFHTFNALYEAGNNIVMTCDKPPGNLSFLEERLRTRFASGLIVDIQPPDYETRVAILNQRSREKNIHFPTDVIEYIAGNISSNIRELEGAFNTVTAFAMLSGEINLQIAMAALKDVISQNPKNKLDEQTIIEVVSAFYNITVDDIKSKRRNNEIAYPRQVAMFLLRTVLNLTFEQIAKIFGNHYSTVIHGCEKIEKLRKDDDKSRREIETLLKSIQVE